MVEWGIHFCIPNFFPNKILYCNLGILGHLQMPTYATFHVSFSRDGMGAAGALNPLGMQPDLAGGAQV